MILVGMKMNVGESSVDLNMDNYREEFGRANSSIFSRYNSKGRLIVTGIAVFSCIFSLTFFIGSVVVHQGANSETTTKPTPNQSPTEGPDAEEAEPFSVTTVNGLHMKPGLLIFNEEFNSFNTTVWNHFVGTMNGNEFVSYVKDGSNSFVRDGKLFIKATENPSWTASKMYPISVAEILTKKSFRWKYGRMMIRAKMPAADWTVPIIRLKPVGSIYGDGYASGEINLVDTRGNRNLFNEAGVNIGSEKTCPDIKFGINESDNKVLYDCSFTNKNQGFDRDFHDYELLWTPSSLTIKIDGKLLVLAPSPSPSFFKLCSKGRNVDNPWTDANNKIMAPFDVEFYLTIDLYVGGTSGTFPDSARGPYPKPWNNSDAPSVASEKFMDDRNNWGPSWEGDDAALQIESVKVWSLNMTPMDEEEL